MIDLNSKVCGDIPRNPDFWTIDWTFDGFSSTSHKNLRLENFKFHRKIVISEKEGEIIG